MIDSIVEILLVEDNLNDIKLAIYAFEKHRLANVVHVVRDGAEAWNSCFAPTAMPIVDSRTVQRLYCWT